MSAIYKPVFYAPPQREFQQTLGYGIARYGLFSYITSDRVNSNLTPYIKANLPPQLRNLTTAYASQKKSVQRRGIKKKFIARFFQVLPSILQTTQQANQSLFNPFALMSQVLGGKLPGKNELYQDTAWGTATVITNSLQTDLLWSTSVKLGSTEQTLRINIDTGSSDFVVLDPKCKNCGLNIHAAFLYAQSTSFSASLDIQFDAAYADGGQAAGYLGTDVLDFGNGVRAPQVFGLATDVSSSWTMQGVDGLMGLGPDSLSSFPPPYNQGVFTQLLASQVLAQPVIGIALAKAALNSSGEFTFGKVDSRWIRGGSSQMLWKNVTSKNFWGTDLSGIYVNNKNMMGSDDPPRAIVDTGTSLMLVSVGAAAAIHGQIPGAVMDPSNGIWRLPCQTGAPENGTNPMKAVASNVGSLFGKMFYPYTQVLKPKHRRVARFFSSPSVAATTPPNIFIELGAGKPRFGIPASDLPYQAIPSSDKNSIASDGKTVMCYSGIQAGADGFFVLGGTFIKNQYIALRRETSGNSMGFGNRTDVPIIY